MRKRTLPRWWMKKWAVAGSGCSILFVLICIFGGAPTEIAAQEPFSLQPGERVRVTALDCGLRGGGTEFRALRADTLVLETTECPLASVTRLDVSRGRKSHARLGAGIGFVAGALGAVVACRGGCVIGEEDDFSDFAVPFAFAIGLIGGVAGGITGLFIKTDRWEEVPIERLRVSPTPQRPVGNDVDQKSWAGLMTGGYSTGVGSNFGGGSSVGFTAGLYRVRSPTFKLGFEVGYTTALVATETLTSTSVDQGPFRSRNSTGVCCVPPPPRASSRPGRRSVPLESSVSVPTGLGRGTTSRPSTPMGSRYRCTASCRFERKSDLEPRWG